ncbi:hypothetical protein ACSBR1_013803 [Camellia fascicularis]
MGMESSMFARRPALLSLSLEKRIVPRCGGLIKKASSLRASLESTEKLFQNKFVNCHEEEAPELVKLYEVGGEEKKMSNLSTKEVIILYSCPLTVSNASFSA